MRLIYETDIYQSTRGRSDALVLFVTPACHRGRSVTGAVTFVSSLAALFCEELGFDLEHSPSRAM